MPELISSIIFFYSIACILCCIQPKTKRIFSKYILCFADGGDTDSIPELGRSPEEGNGNTLQYYLGNLMNRGGLWAIVHGVAKE